MRKSFPVQSFSKNSQTHRSYNLNEHDRRQIQCKHRNLIFESYDHFSHKKNRKKDDYQNNNTYNIPITHTHPEFSSQNKSGNCKMAGHNFNSSYNCKPNPLASPFYPSKDSHTEKHPGWLASSSSSDSSNSYDDFVCNNCYCNVKCHQNSYKQPPFNHRAHSPHRPQHNSYYTSQANFSPKCSYSSLLNTLCLSPEDQQNFYTKSSADLLQKYQPCCFPECSNRKIYRTDSSLSFYEPHCVILSPIGDTIKNNKYEFDCGYDSECPSSSICLCSRCERSLDKKNPCKFNNFQHDDKPRMAYANSSSSSFNCPSECRGKIPYVNGVPKITSDILIQRKNKLKQLKSQCYDLKIYKELESIEDLLSALIAQASPSTCIQPGVASQYIDKRVTEIKHSH